MENIRSSLRIKSKLTDSLEIKKLKLKQSYEDMLKKAEELKKSVDEYVNTQLKKINQS